MLKNMRQKSISRKKNVDRTSRDEKLAKQRLDLELDRQLEATFPASDALKITFRQSDRPVKSKRMAGTKR